MSYNIGPKIGIEGEKEFRNSIENINLNLRTLDSEMKVVASQFDKNDKSTEAVASRNEVLNKQIEEQTKKLDLLQQGLKSASEKYGENDKVTQGWQQAVNKATADLNEMKSELSDNEKSLDGFGTELDDATEKSKKLDGALSGILGGLSKVGGAVAKAAIVGVTAVGTAAIGAATGLFKLAGDAGEAADDLLTLSAQTGISTKQLQEMQYAAQFVDVPLETMTASMAKMVKSMSSATDETTATGAAFKTLGVDVRDKVTGELRNNKEVWLEVIDALGDIANETERDALAMELFGKSAQDLNPLIVAGSDELARLAEEAKEVGAVLGDDAIKEAGKFDDMIQKIKASVKGFATSLGVMAMPAIMNFLGIFSDIIPELTAAVQSGDWTSAGTAVTDGINQMLAQVTDILPGVAMIAVTIISGLATTLVTVIPQVLPSIIDATLQLLNMLIQTLADNGPMLITAGLDALMMIIRGIVESLPQLIDVAIQLLMALVNGIIENLPSLMDAAINIVLTLIDGILELLPELIPAAIKAIVTLANGLIDALPKLIEKLPQIIETIVTVLIDNLPLLIDASIEIVVALTTAIIDNLPLIIEAAIKIIGALVEGILSAVGSLLEVVPELFSQLKTAFSEIDWAELGKNLIDGITEGVKTAASALANGVVNAAKSALDAAKDFLGIQSPSTVMRDQVGLMIGAGMAEGIKKSTSMVNNAMSSLNDQIHVSDIKAGLQVESGQYKAGYGSVSNSSNTITNYYTFNSPKALDEATINRNVRREGQRLQLLLASEV